MPLGRLKLALSLLLVLLLLFQDEVDRLDDFLVGIRLAIDACRVSPFMFGADADRDRPCRVDDASRLQLLVDRDVHPDPSLGGRRACVYADANPVAKKFAQRIVRIARCPKPERTAQAFEGVVAA